MGTVGVVSFIILIIIEYRLLHKTIYCILSYFQRELPLKAEGVDDNDVYKEKIRIDAMQLEDIQTHNLVMQKLSKFYGSFLAVNQLSIGIKKYSFFLFNQFHILFSYTRHCSSNYILI